MRKITFNLKREWFEAFKNGSKIKEFRVFNEFWRKRLEGRDFDVVELCLGYPKKCDNDRRIYKDWAGLTVEEIVHPEFNNKKIKVFATHTKPLTFNIKEIL